MVLMAHFMTLLVSLGLAGQALAASAAIDTLPDMPTVRRINDIEYVSGGVGVEQVAAMRGMAARFNVHLQFVNEHDGSSLSDVTVTLFDARRTIVLLVLSEGPLLYLKLPPGDYRAVVRAEGVIECRTIRVRPDGRAQTLLLRLPAPAQGAGAP